MRVANLNIALILKRRNVYTYFFLPSNGGISFLKCDMLSFLYLKTSFKKNNECLTNRIFMAKLKVILPEAFSTEDLYLDHKVSHQFKIR